MKKVVIFTDGACSGNPGPGGYGILMKYGNSAKELSGGYRKTTNNRMELLAVIVALESLKEKCDVKVFTDSKYIVDAITQGWARRWQKNGWMRNKRDAAENPDLWEKLLALFDQHTIMIEWVKGHAGHPENERADHLATSAIKSDKLLVDEFYENR